MSYFDKFIELIGLNLTTVHSNPIYNSTMEIIGYEPIIEYDIAFIVKGILLIMFFSFLAKITILAFKSATGVR